MRAADSLSAAAMTRICQVTVSPVPGPFTVSVVLPIRFPVSIPVPGSKLASPVSATLQRKRASGTALLSAAGAFTWNFAAAWVGAGPPGLAVGGPAGAPHAFLATDAQLLRAA